MHRFTRIAAAFIVVAATLLTVNLRAAPAQAAATQTYLVLYKGNANLEIRPCGQLPHCIFRVKFRRQDIGSQLLHTSMPVESSGCVKFCDRLAN